jgi:hypothetical protein
MKHHAVSIGPWSILAFQTSLLQGGAYEVPYDALIFYFGLTMTPKK